MCSYFSDPMPTLRFDFNICILRNTPSCLNQKCFLFIFKILNGNQKRKRKMYLLLQIASEQRCNWYLKHFLLCYLTFKVLVLDAKYFYFSKLKEILITEWKFWNALINIYQKLCNWIYIYACTCVFLVRMACTYEFSWTYCHVWKVYSGYVCVYVYAINTAVIRCILFSFLVQVK